MMLLSYNGSPVLLHLELVASAIPGVHLAQPRRGLVGRRHRACSSASGSAVVTQAERRAWL